MPCYETKQKNEDGSSIYQDICYPVTAKFREKLYGEILGGYEKAKTEPKKTAPDNETKTTEAKTNPRTKKENSKKEDKSR
jgi:DNA-binding cell septation regulator SpoVG